MIWPKELEAKSVELMLLAARLKGEHRHGPAAEVLQAAGLLAHAAEQLDLAIDAEGEPPEGDA